jgi:AraC family transcriptional activator of pobA
MKNGLRDIPHYNLKSFRPIHREDSSGSTFGNNMPDASKIIEGFELYFGDGMVPEKGPLKSIFYILKVLKMN